MPALSAELVQGFGDKGHFLRCAERDVTPGIRRWEGAVNQYTGLLHVLLELFQRHAELVKNKTAFGGRQIGNFQRY
ncbi:hypothetical protein [Serratia quinivorans]|uniref:hypothetical protein n=1 Tax=Serratia quinivorans TaxID=137545 RepID=UPI0021BDD3C0|nr:hypothetical protein [Serratia quinivorans]